jgi:hypothetical protein
MVKKQQHIAIILSENNLSDIIIEELVCRNTCFECNYNIWITFCIFLWNYESIKVGVQLVFNTIWEWHRFNSKTNGEYYFKHVQFHFSDRITYNLWEKTIVDYTTNQNSKTVIKTIIDDNHLGKIIDQK